MMQNWGHHEQSAAAKERERRKAIQDHISTMGTQKPRPGADAFERAFCEGYGRPGKDPLCEEIKVNIHGGDK